ncbi:hypothetical protein [Xanthomonas campestris]|uniref:hypothetical protein n=1 Tax=Xanthomonas campestris TaxID=339 RepID=UPI00096DF093|nr:hypothetical protein [Xanthomonas campestris]MEA9842207.1 hypothetical protein [Xanthomonas campestris pv. raphani]MEA9878554.1 hypothetical protein [Xanthomonas campestris pv. raphani]MEA9894935.1 hypothetical protein [Xanthomonas campestris pv. raphani]QLC68954.1 hypothetical protein AD14011_05105 [Xanthomonas campestris pv. raphani]WDJ17297.1 hypothetical protein JH264_15940 [Xanthomonas campestris pv. raphani]
MTIKASAVTPAKAIELAPGALFTIEEKWYLRTLLKGQQEQDIESAVPLSEGAEFIHVGAEPCITLAPFHSYECRLIGAINGPGRPLPGSLTWTVGGELVVAWDAFFVTFAGFESKDVNKGEAFYVTHWGMWMIGENGKPASPDPLFVVGADR